MLSSQLLAIDCELARLQIWLQEQKSIWSGESIMPNSFFPLKLIFKISGKRCRHIA